jgi:hypothetical protein
MNDCGERCIRNGDPSYNLPETGEYEALLTVEAVLAKWRRGEIRDFEAVKMINKELEDMR